MFQEATVNPIVFECIPNYQCPNCQTPMMIAGRHEKWNVEGQSREQMHQCHNCHQRIIPKRMTEYNDQKD